MKKINLILTILYFFAFLITSIFYVPSDSNLNGNLVFINWLSSNLEISLPKYVILQLILLVTYIFLRKIFEEIINKFDFNITIFKKYSKYLLFLIIISFSFGFLYLGYELFIVKPKLELARIEKEKEKELARIEKEKEEELERIRYEKFLEQIKIEEKKKEEIIKKQKEEQLKRNAIKNEEFEKLRKIPCSVESAEYLYKEFVNFYGEDFKVRNLKFRKVGDCEYDISLEVFWFSWAKETEKIVLDPMDARKIKKATLMTITKLNSRF